MARKKPEAPAGGNAPWLNTFADLMNLLLCFFVLLFAFSTVNEEKFEEISISMANSIGVLDGGSSSVIEGALISSGISQLNELDDYFASMGKTTEGDTNTEDASNSEQTAQGSQSSDGVLNSSQGAQGIEGSKGSQGTEGEQGSQGTEGTDSASTSKEADIKQAMQKIEEEREKASAGMYDQVSELTEQYNLGDYVELSIDSEYKYVELTLKGSILFASGEAEIKELAKPILNNIGNIMEKFDGYSIEIVGHTDNVPMSSKEFKDNNWLSSARALNTAEYLINYCDIDPVKLKYSGRGENEPISSNSTADGRAKNRRIEIRIYNQYSGQ